MTLSEKVEVLPLGVTPAAAVLAILPTTTTLAVKTLMPRPTTSNFPPRLYRICHQGRRVKSPEGKRCWSQNCLGQSDRTPVIRHTDDIRTLSCSEVLITELRLNYGPGNFMGGGMCTKMLRQNELVQFSHCVMSNM